MQVTVYGVRSIRNDDRQLVRSFAQFMEPEGSLTCWQEPVTCPCSQTDAFQYYLPIYAQVVQVVCFLVAAQREVGISRHHHIPHLFHP